MENNTGTIVKKFNTILALNLCNRCGYVVEKNGMIEFGEWNLNPYHRFESGGMKYVRFVKCLSEIMPDIIFFKIVKFYRAGMIHMYKMNPYLAHLESFCCERNIEYESVTFSQLKEFSQAETKMDFVTLANKKFKKELTYNQESQAVALWILEWGKQNRLPKNVESITLPKVEVSC